MTTKRSETENYEARIAQLQASINAEDSALKEHEMDLRPRDAAMASLEEIIAAKRRMYRPPVEHFYDPQGGTADALTLLHYQAQPKEIECLLWYACGDLLREAFKRDLLARYENQRAWPSDEARRAWFADHAARVDALERDEEATIRAAKQAGVNLERRGDADPAIVLAGDDGKPDPRRFHDLSDTLAERHAVARECSDRYRDARDELRRREAIVHRYDDPYTAMMSGPCPERYREDVTRQRAEVQRLEMRWQQASELMLPLSRLVNACRVFLEKNNVDLGQPDASLRFVRRVSEFSRV